MHWLGQGLYMAAAMLWETWWALVLGISLSACLQVFVRNDMVVKRFGRTGVGSVGLAMLFGAASSSCSYAAASTAKTAFKKGAALVPTLAFMFASTNLVLELGILLWMFLGWQFLLAEVVGAFVLIGVMWLLVALTLPKGLVEQARAHQEEATESGCCGQGKDHGHADNHGHGMEMAHGGMGEKSHPHGNWARVADAFVMEVSMLWKEILIGFVIAGFLMALVPEDWWKSLFLTQHGGWVQLLENAVAGPLIAVGSFVCSVGNVPLAAALWAGGISFGGVISFIYADLIILPLVLIYRKYYGLKMGLYITGVMFVSMVAAGIAVDLLFGALGWIPTVRTQSVISEAAFRWNYTTYLNIVAILYCGYLWARRRG